VPDFGSGWFPVLKKSSLSIDTKSSKLGISCNTTMRAPNPRKRSISGPLPVVPDSLEANAGVAHTVTTAKIFIMIFMASSFRHTWDYSLLILLKSNGRAMSHASRWLL
jgi:hypothetical protein